MRPNQLALGAIALALGFAALAAGCGGTSQLVSTPTTTVPAVPATSAPAPSVDYQAQYRADLAPLLALESSLVSESGAATTAQLTRLSGALTTFGHELLAQSWPAKVDQDAHSLALVSLSAAPTVRTSGLAAAAVSLEKANSEATALQSALAARS